jgi:hypothetical protein
MATDAAVIGFERWRDIEDEFFEMPGLTLRQAQERRALTLAIDALLEDLFCGKGRPQATSRLSSELGGR